MSWEEKLEDARRRHRPSLKNWQRDGMYHKFPLYQKALADAGHPDTVLVFRYGSSNSSSSNSKSQTNDPQMQYTQHNLPVRLSARHVSVAEFEQAYEQPRIPSVIADVPLVEEWPAVQRWTLNALQSDLDLESRYFKCGEDDDGKSIKVKLKYFLQYLQSNQDDSPLYIFDTAFDEDKLARRLCENDYRVPRYFRNDLFRYVSESRRPPYRWWLVGPARSGTTVHVDPLGTAAWNTLLVGKKRWVLFPPHVPKSIVKGKGLIGKQEDDEAIHYFTIILPRIRARAKAVLEQQQQNGHFRPQSAGDYHVTNESSSVRPEQYRNFACYEFTQHAGETVFVPTGWWHAVLNLEHTVGCTQNFCSPRNFDDVWVASRSGRKKMAWKWLQALRTHEPALYQRALALNERDNFIMKYDPQASDAYHELKRKEKEEEEYYRNKRKSVV